MKAARCSAEQRTPEVMPRLTGLLEVRMEGRLPH